MRDNSGSNPKWQRSILTQLFVESYIVPSGDYDEWEMGGGRHAHWLYGDMRKILPNGAPTKNGVSLQL